MSIRAQAILDAFASSRGPSMCSTFPLLFCSSEFTSLRVVGCAANAEYDEGWVSCNRRLRECGKEWCCCIIGAL